MRNTIITWDEVIAAIVLLLSAYITFLGLLYREGWTVLTALLVALGLVAATSACIYFMSKAKASKWHKAGTAVQIILAIIVVVLFAFASSPFNNFISALQHKQQLNELTGKVRESALDMGKSYNEYAENRIALYRQGLSGADTLRAVSLRRHILPSGIDSIQAQRSNWLQNMESMSPWNIALPQNLDMLNESALQWYDNYVATSSLMYSDEPSPQPFSYNQIDNNTLSSITSLRNEMAHPGFSIIALLIALAASAFMFLPYFFTRSLPQPKNEEKW